MYMWYIGGGIGHAPLDLGQEDITRDGDGEIRSENGAGAQNPPENIDSESDSSEAEGADDLEADDSDLGPDDGEGDDEDDGYGSL
jgi:hypothetical protein